MFVKKVEINDCGAQPTIIIGEICALDEKFEAYYSPKNSASFSIATVDTLEEAENAIIGFYFNCIKQ